MKNEFYPFFVGYNYVTIFSLTAFCEMNATTEGQVYVVVCCILGVLNTFETKKKRKTASE